MKTWEMIKELTENPNKEFEITGSKHLIAQVGVSTGSIIFKNTSQGCGFNPSTKWEWEEVKTPVTWQEAMQAFVENNKNFRIEMPSGNAYTQRQGYKIGALKVNGLDSRFFEMDMFTEGKWYIED